MRILSIDPGAQRLGWAVLEKAVGDDVRYTPPNVVAFGLGGFKQEKLKYQEYRLKLIDYWVDKARTLLHDHMPDVVVSEIVPPVGGGAFSSNGIQSQLAVAAVTTFQAMACDSHTVLVQMAANTIKANIGGSKQATKQQVRNGVISIVPELEVYRKDWTKIFDVPDALAVGLCWLGYNRKV